MGNNSKSKITPYLYLVPCMLIFGIFLFYPFVKTIYLSLYKTNKMGQAKLYVGLGNYKELLQSASFINSLKVTLIFVLIVVVGGMLLGLIAAVLCNKAFPGIRVFSTSYALPMAIASSSAAMIFQIMLHPAVGNMSKEELLELKKAMNAKALARRRTKTALRVTANVVFAVLILLPLLYAISIALMPSSELFTTELNLFPKNPTFSNFINAFRTVPLLRFILNSFIMAGCITIGQIITCSLAAFAFSFLEFKGKGILFMVVMATMMVPGEATIISNYLTVSSWGMLDTYQVLIVPYLTSAMGIFLFRQFYMTFPISLYESAKLDGCSNLKFIVRILLPLTKSAIGAMAVYTFINAWNMYMWPLLVTGSNNMRTVQIGISMLDSVDSQSITLMIAGVVMIIIPSISIFIIGQKQLIRGMFSGAVKG